MTNSCFWLVVVMSYHLTWFPYCLPPILPGFSFSSLSSCRYFCFFVSLFTPHISSMLFLIVCKSQSVTRDLLSYSRLSWWSRCISCSHLIITYVSPFLCFHFLALRAMPPLSSKMLCQTSQHSSSLFIYLSNYPSGVSSTLANVFSCFTRILSKYLLFYFCSSVLSPESLKYLW